MDKIQQEYALCAYLMTVTGAVAASATTAGTAIDAIYGNLIVIRRQLSVHCTWKCVFGGGIKTRETKRKQTKWVFKINKWFWHEFIIILKYIIY